MSHTLSPDSADHSQTASPSLDIPKIDLMNEMKDILKLRLDTPPIDRSVSTYFPSHNIMVTLNNCAFDV